MELEVMMNAQLPVTVTATLLDGELKLDHPLDLPSGTRVKVVISSAVDSSALDTADQQIVTDILNEDRDVFQALAR